MSWHRHSRASVNARTWPAIRSASRLISTTSSTRSSGRISKASCLSGTRMAAWSSPVLPNGSVIESLRLSISTRFCLRMDNRCPHFAGPGAPSWPEHMVAPIPAATFRVNAKDAAWVDRKMTPHPVRCFTESLRVSGAYPTIAEKLYIRALTFPSTTFDAAFDRCRADRAWRTSRDEMRPRRHDRSAGRACGDSRRPGQVP